MNNKIRILKTVCNILNDQNQDKNYDEDIARAIKEADEVLNVIERADILLTEVCNDFETEGCEDSGTVSVETINQCREYLGWAKIEPSNAEKVPYTSETEYCDTCGTVKRTFMHNCDTSNYQETFGCPKCDDSCGFCKK